MTDRQLLVLAAKAAGYVIESFTDDGAWVYEAGASKNADGEYPIFLWRPRHDDGDALRLAVRLRMDVTFNEMDVFVFPPDGSDGVSGLINVDDPYAATRRAILWAAAERNWVK